MTPLAELQRRAAADAALELREERPHIAGLALGMAALALGVWASERAVAWAGWVALAGIVLSMALARWWIERGVGWRIDFARRALAPVGREGAEVALEGSGWLLRTGPGEKFASVAIDLMHDDRGRVARLFERHALRRAHRRQIGRIADTLAERLALPRGGIRE